MGNLPYIVNVTTAAPAPIVYPPTGDVIPPFVRLEDCLLSLRVCLLHAMPPYLSFKAEMESSHGRTDYFIMPRRRWPSPSGTVVIDYDWLLAFCDPGFRLPIREALLARIQSATDLVAAHIDVSEFEQFLGQMITMASLHNAASCLRYQDTRRQSEGRPGFVALLKHGMGLESVLPFEHIHWSGTMNEITAERFTAAVGRAPEDDDLDRCNCRDAGKIGHSGCGWCQECDRPRFICGHPLAAPETLR
jgi:hypothetical protein